MSGFEAGVQMQQRLSEQSTHALLQATIVLLGVLCFILIGYSAERTNQRIAALMVGGGLVGAGVYAGIKIQKN